MRSKFNGKCAHCGEGFKAGAEIEYVKGEGAYLPGHRPEPDETPTPEDYELAEKLGFR